MTAIKKVLSTVLAGTMLTACAVPAFAAEEEVIATRKTVYVSDNGNYEAEKITHPEAGIMTNDGIVDYLGGGVVGAPDEDTKGDRAQNYSWSAYGYGDDIYVGTCPNAMLSTLSFMKTVLGDNYDEKTIMSAFDVAFNGAFYIGEEDGGDPKGILVKINSKTGEVKLLMSKATTGTNVQLRNAVMYNGMLYFCGSINGLPGIIEVNPDTDECKQVYQSINQKDYYLAYQKGISAAVRGIGVFDGKLIASFVGLDGAYICETETPSDPDSYRVIADMDDLFNYPAYRFSDSIYGGSIWEMESYNGSLYVSICTGKPENKPDANSMQSFAVVRGDRAENGDWTWTSVIGDQKNDGAKYCFGIDPERTRAGAGNLYVYDGYLYIAEYNDEEIPIEEILFKKNAEFMNANLEQSVNLYRMDENENIELVVGDADEMFPEGSLTGYGSGFDRHENQYIWRMQEFDGKLYIGTFDTSSLLEPLGQFTNGDLLDRTPEDWAKQVEYLKKLFEILKKDKQDMISMSDINEAMDELEAIDELFNSSASISFIEGCQKLVKIVKSFPEKIKKAVEEFLDSKDIKNLMSFIPTLQYLSKAERGFDLYVLDKDMNVDVVTTNGFGDPYNHGCRVFAVNDNGLFVGTANPFYGTQVWHVVTTYIEPDMDVNNDGRVNILDVTELSRILAEEVTVTDEKYATLDLDQNGIVNVSDTTYLQRYLSNLTD